MIGFDLDRFKRAQDRPFEGFETALGELQAGRKRSHWIWYIFPQLAGLGTSAMSARFGLEGEAETAAYLRDPLLRERLVAVMAAVLVRLESQPAPALNDLMGSDIDALKLVSSATLFHEIARRLNEAEPRPEIAEVADKAEALLRAAAEQGYTACESTRRRLG
jgi:uncharacterized protein (DUF1810 family)